MTLSPRPDRDEALLEDLARIAAAELGWIWQTTPTPVSCASPTVEAVLDRLIELGWRPPTPTPTAPQLNDPAQCVHYFPTWEALPVHDPACPGCGELYSRLYPANYPSRQR